MAPVNRKAILSEKVVMIGSIALRKRVAEDDALARQALGPAVRT